MFIRSIALASVVLMAACGASAATGKAATKKAAAPPPATAPAPPKEEKPLVVQDGANVSFPRFGFKWVTPHKEWKPEMDASAAVSSGGYQIQLTRDDLMTVIRLALFEVPKVDPTQTAESLKASIDPVAAKVTIGPLETSQGGLRAGFTVESTDPQMPIKDRITVLRPLGKDHPLMMVVIMRTFLPTAFDAAMADLTSLLDSIQPL